MKDTFPQAGIHKYVRAYINSLDLPDGASCLDCPAGDGRTSFLLKRKKYEVKSLDLYPQFMKVSDIICQRADLSEGLPSERDSTYNFIVCQEGLEHMQDQLMVLNEFNRVLKKKGKLLITVPSYSHLRARLSYLLTESEFYRRMPANEADSIWYSKEDEKNYYGHVFLLGVQKLRTLGALSGFKISSLEWSEISSSSVFLFLLLYPFVFLTSSLAYLRSLKNKSDLQKKILKQVFILNIHPKVLLCKHTIMVFEKERTASEVHTYLQQMSR